MGKRRDTFILPAPQLYTRQMTAAILGRINVASVRRMEEDGILTPIIPSGKPTGMVFHSAKQVCELAQCDPVDVALQLQAAQQAGVEHKRPTLPPPIQRKRLGGG